MTMDEAKSDFDTIIDLQPTVAAEPTKHQDTESWRTTATEGVGEYAPIKHGRWLRTDAYPHRRYCSVCFATFIRNDEFLHLEDIPHDYCPNCGAKMDGGEE